MSGELELYQQAIDAASLPISVRLEHYGKVMCDIREALSNYFFDKKRTTHLSEAVQKAMKECLVDENILIKAAKTKKDNVGHPSFMIALDDIVLNNSLSITLQENGLYSFKPEVSSPPKTQDLMHQFTYALSIYRVCLGVCESYLTLYRSENLKIEPLKNHLESAQHLKQQLTEDADLITLHKQIKTIEKAILGLLRTEKVHEGLDVFTQHTDALTTKLAELLEFGAIKLEDCYKEFPNNPYLWVLHDRSWHSLLKNLSGLLYVNQYTYSTLQGSLVINREFINHIKKEIDHFKTVALEKTSLLKIELLKTAAKVISETKIDILAKIAEKGITLIEAPKAGMFSTVKSPNMYQLMVTFQQSKKDESGLCSPTTLQTF